LYDASQKSRRGPQCHYAGRLRRQSIFAVKPVLARNLLNFGDAGAPKDENQNLLINGAQD